MADTVEQMQELVPATSQLVAIFLKDPQLQQLFPEVMEKQADTEHFARYFPRLLRIFGDDLTIEAQEQAQKVAARYIKSEASHVTGLLQEKYGDGSTVSNLGVQAQEITLDNSDEEFPEEEALDDLEPVRKWIIESMAFSWLREALKSFVLRPSSIVVGKSSEGTNAIQGSEHSRSGQKEVGPGALQEQYEDVIDMIEVALGKSENYAWHPQVAVALDETLLRLEIWEDEITSEGEPKLDGILRIAGKEYRELSNTACEALAILQNRITAVLGWQERFAEALEEEPHLNISRKSSATKISAGFTGAPLNSPTPNNAIVSTTLVPVKELLNNLVEALKDFVNSTDFIASLVESRTLSRRIMSILPDKEKDLPGSQPRQKAATPRLPTTRDTASATTRPGDYLLAAAHEVTCISHQIRKRIYHHAVRKDGNSANGSDTNLLFPFSITRRIVTETVLLEAVLICGCILCEQCNGSAAVFDEETVRAILASSNLHTTIIIMVSMGATFAIHSFLENGLLNENHDIGQLEYVRASTTALFRDLKAGLFPNGSVKPQFMALSKFNTKSILQLQDELCETYRYTSNLFRPPEMGKGMCDTLPREANLPFIKERDLDETRSHLLHIKKLEIHTEYLARRIQNDITYQDNKEFVRKKLYIRKASDVQSRLAVQDELDLLLLLAREENHHPKIIKMFFAFKMYEGETEIINLIFPKYPGSLEEILDENLPFEPPGYSPDSSVFRGCPINHWLWGEVVDLLEGVQFLHEKLIWHNEFQSAGERGGRAVIMGHFDLKPANILIDRQGHLIITDFGLAQMKALESGSAKSTGLQNRSGTLSYSAPESTATDRVSLSRSYDVWSMACVILEVAVFILPGALWESAKKEKHKQMQPLLSSPSLKGGKLAVEKFTIDRIAEGRAHHKEPCFWMIDGKSKMLKTCVKSKIIVLENSDDHYLSSVGDTLQEMFRIDPKSYPGRPTAEVCRQMLLRQTQIHPPEGEGEPELIELCGDHTARPFSRMRVLVSKSAMAPAIPCRLQISQTRAGGKHPKTKLIVHSQLRGRNSPDPDIWFISEEELIPLRIYGKQNPNTMEACKFLHLHPGKTFKFESVTDFYTFQSALTRQQVRGIAENMTHPQNPVDSLANYCIPIKQCWYQPSGIFKLNPKKIVATGVIQFWQELPPKAHLQKYMLDTRTGGSQLSSGSSTGQPRLGISSQALNGSQSQLNRKLSTFTHSSALNTKSRDENYQDACRLAIQLASPTGTLITVDLAQGDAYLDEPEYIQRETSCGPCILFRAASRNFEIGLFEEGIKDSPRTYSALKPPGIPLDPNVLRERETTKVKWLELEFENKDARASFDRLYKKTFGG